MEGEEESSTTAVKESNDSSRKDSPQKDSNEQQGDNSSIWDNSVASAISKPFVSVAKPLQKATQAVVVQPVKSATKAVKSATKPRQAAVAGGASQTETKTEVEDSPQEQSSLSAFLKAPNQLKEGTGKTIEYLYMTHQKMKTRSLQAVRRGKKKTEETKQEEQDQGQPALPPDEQLQSMDVIVTKKLQGVSIKDFYEICWSEGNGTDKKPFYGPWLVDSGKLDVKVEDWQFAENDDELVGEWDKEAYDQKRTVAFRFERTTALLTGPPMADVKQTHYCRRQGDDRCIVSTTVEMEGVPFSDAFNVQIRWVATRVGINDLSIKVGLFVVFLKQVVVAGKIRSGTKEETTKTQLDLFKNMKKACGAEEGVAEEITPEEVGGRGIADLFFKQPVSYLCHPFFHKESENDVVVEMRQVRDKLKIVKALELPDDPTQDERKKYIISEFTVVRDALDSILLRELQLQKTLAPVKTDKAQLSLDGFDAIVTPFKELFGQVNKIGADARDRLESRGGQQKSAQQEKESTVPEVVAQVAPDEVLKSMDVIFSKTISDASIQRLYDVCFSEGNGTNEEPFYGPWLQTTGKEDVEVGDWELGDFVEDWSKESYQQKRTVTYQFKRAGLASRDPINASVEQTQHSRIEGNNKLVVATLTETSGVPFSDTFRVHIRWVFTLSGSNEILVKVGLFVLFTKNTLLSGKIRAATTQETAKTQMDLFKNIKKAFGGTEQSIQDQLSFENEESTSFGLASLFEQCSPRMRRLAHPSSGPTVEDDEELAGQIKIVERKLRAVDVFLDDEEQSAERMNFVLGQLVVAREALDDIVLWHGAGNQEEAPETSA